MKAVRDAQNQISKPVIFVAHVRKSDRGKSQLIPGLEDFHGTSDIGKIATKAVMLAPAHDQPPAEKHHAPTYIEPMKCRQDGSRTRFVGLVPFNFRTGLYERKYDLGKLDGAREKFTFLDESEVPSWATGRLQ